MAQKPGRKYIIIAALGLGGCRMAIGLAALAVAIVIIGGMLSAAIRGDLGLPSIPTPMFSRTVLGGTLSLREHWRKSGVVIPYYDERVVASEEYVGFVTSYITRWQRKDQLHVLRVRSGESLWEIANFPDVYFLAMDNQRLFAVTRQDLRVYDPTRGELLWHTAKPLGGYARYGLERMGEDILIYFAEDTFVNRREQVLLRYDARSGELKEMSRFEVSPNVRLVLRSSSTNYWTDGHRLWAEDRASLQIRWEVHLERRLEHRPILVGSFLIYASGLHPKLYAVDTTTGILQWAYEYPLVSNFALDDHLYAIRQDGALVGIDPWTGQERGYIQFHPARTENTEYCYWVAASDSWVFAYFGDSQELIGLGP